MQTSWQRLSDMLPRPSANGSVDTRLGNAVRPANGFVRNAALRIPISDLQNNGISQLCMPRPDALRPDFSGAPLVFAIGFVVFPRAEEKVIWVNAWPVVAFVADEKPSWDWTVREFIGKAMRALRRWAYPKMSIPI